MTRCPHHFTMLAAAGAVASGLWACDATTPAAPDGAPPVITSRTDPDGSTPVQSPPTDAGTTDGSISTDAGDAAPPTDNPWDRIDPDDPYLGLSEPEAGFRLVTRGRTIPPDSDVEYCEVSELPGTPEDEYYVRATETANGLNSHHLIVSAAIPGSETERKLRDVEIGTQTPCIGASIEYGEDMVQLTATQTPYLEAAYPEGVALRVQGGQRVVFDYHYFNFTDEDVIAKSALAVHTIEAEKVRSVATVFSISNMTLEVPPYSEANAEGACVFDQDVMVQGLTRHTHEHGTGFDVWFEGGERDGEHIWHSGDWIHDQHHDFEEPILVRAGEGFRYDCGFRNDTQRALRFGISSTDEMCILGGAIWSPTPGVEMDPINCTLNWVDEDGVARSADHGDGFPPASFDDAIACHFDTFGFGFVDACVGCICDQCGSVMARCNEDPDCKPLLECRTSCTAEDNCNEKCESVMFEHSPGVGKLTAVGSCISSMCASGCAPDGTDP